MKTCEINVDMLIVNYAADFALQTLRDAIMRRDISRLTKANKLFAPVFKDLRIDEDLVSLLGKSPRFTERYKTSSIKQHPQGTPRTRYNVSCGRSMVAANTQANCCVSQKLPPVSKCR